MKENQVIETALQNLQQTRNITGKLAQAGKKNGADAGLELTLPGKTGPQHFNIEVKKELRAYHLPDIEKKAATDPQFMLVAENIFATLKQTLREKNIPYLDAAGNIYINNRNGYIWLDGNKANKTIERTRNRAFTKAGLKVIFYFLNDPLAVNHTYQQITAATGVAIGNMKNILDGLKTAGFLLRVNNKELQLINRKTLLERWTTGYREILKPALFLGNFELPKEGIKLNWEKLALLPGAVWGAEPAAAMMTGYIRPGVLTVYTTGNKFKLQLAWKLVPKENGELKLYTRFWKDIPTADPLMAPPLLVYTDLLITDDPRNLETAELIYKKYLENELEQY